MSAWPLDDLRVRSPRCELRVPTDEELRALAETASAGLRLERESFLGAWAKPREAFGREFLQYHWLQRAMWTPTRWSLELVVDAGAGPAGMVKLAAEFFPQMRTVTTGGWLSPDARGRGTGLEMRRLGIRLAGALGAERAQCYVHPDNAASLAVCRRLGYESSGERWVSGADSEPYRELILSIDPAQVPTDDVEVEGLSEAAVMFAAKSRG